MTCVGCKVRQVDNLCFGGKSHTDLEIAFCCKCRYNDFPKHLVHDKQYATYWLIRSKPYIEARKRNS